MIPHHNDALLVDLLLRPGYWTMRLFDLKRYHSHRELLFLVFLVKFEFCASRKYTMRRYWLTSMFFTYKYCHSLRRVIEVLFTCHSFVSWQPHPRQFVMHRFVKTMKQHPLKCVKWIRPRHGLMHLMWYTHDWFVTILWDFS